MRTSSSFPKLAFLRGFLLLGLLAPLGSLNAREFYDLFPTPRGLSLGGALTASVDDRSALAYNPAGLALIEDSELRVPDLLAAQFSPDILDIYKKIQGLDTSGGGSSIVSALREFDGTSASFGLDLLGFGWFRRQMGISLNLFSMNAAFRVRTPSVFFAKISTRVTADSGLSFGYAHRLHNNHVRVGFVARPLMIRGGFEKVFENADIANLSGIATQMGIGWGFDFDLGMQANTSQIDLFGFKTKVLFGAVVQNIRAESFANSVKTTIAANVPGLERRASVGVALQLDENQAMVPTLNVDWKDIGVETQHWIEHVCVSVEAVLQPRTWFRSILRGHYSRSQFGGGIAGRLGFGEVEIGTYAVSLGRGPGVGVNRRSYLSLSARW